VNSRTIFGDALEEHLLLLAEVDILEGVPQGALECVAARSRVVYLGKRESIALGEDLRGILLLMSGRVRVHEPVSLGPDLTFSVVEGGTVVGQTGPSPRPSRLLRVEALEPSVLSLVQWEDFEALVLRNPKVGAKTIRILGERLTEYEGRLSDQIRKEVLARLAGLILRLSEPQCLVAGEGSLSIPTRRIPTRYTHRQLASLVGSYREAVTRALGELKKAGVVEIRDQHIHVTDSHTLERFAEAVR
jgi:CRP/FNR family transcriptional regulator, cyclic AMP receptor protein